MLSQVWQSIASDLAQHPETKHMSKAASEVAASWRERESRVKPKRTPAKPIGAHLDPDDLHSVVLHCIEHGQAATAAWYVKMLVRSTRRMS